MTGTDDRSQARREAATLLGVDIENLTAADGLRIDMISATASRAVFFPVAAPIWAS